MNTEQLNDALRVVAETDNCTCGQPALDPHICPYKSEINDKDIDLCTCCENCRHDCAMDI